MPLAPAAYPHYCDGIVIPPDVGFLGQTLWLIRMASSESDTGPNTRKLVENRSLNIVLRTHLKTHTHSYSFDLIDNHLAYNFTSVILLYSYKQQIITSYISFLLLLLLFTNN